MGSILANLYDGMLIRMFLRIFLFKDKFLGAFRYALSCKMKIEGSVSINLLLSIFSSGFQILHALTLLSLSCCFTHLESIFEYSNAIAHEHCRDILNDYTIKMNMMTEVILTAMARSLDLEDNCFLDQYGKEATMTARFNYYPKCPRPDLVLGVKEHADASAITFLLQDKEVEGLQFQKDNQWFKVPIIPEALLINVGDQAEVTITEIA